MIKSKIKFQSEKTKRKNRINKSIVSIMAVIFICSAMSLRQGNNASIIIGLISGTYVAIYLWLNEDYLA